MFDSSVWSIVIGELLSFPFTSAFTMIVLSGVVLLGLFSLKVEKPESAAWICNGLSGVGALVILAVFVMRPHKLLKRPTVFSKVNVDTSIPGWAVTTLVVICIATAVLVLVSAHLSKRLFLLRLAGFFAAISAMLIFIYRGGHFIPVIIGLHMVTCILIGGMLLASLAMVIPNRQMSQSER